MGPAQAMGTFLRVWRAEWAGLSRAQLAIAVTAASPKVKKVTPKVIRRWEEGQPPKTTEEFEALCAVMRRNGLVPLEVKQFRQAVFAACLDRQYPEVFGGEDHSRREDIEDTARLIHERELSKDRQYNRVQLVALIHELERAVCEEPESAVGRDPRHAQLSALAWLYRTLSDSHQEARRHRLSAIGRAAVARFVETQLASQPPGRPLSPAVCRAFAARSAAQADGRPDGLWRMFEVVDDAEGAGEALNAVYIFFCALNAATWEGTRTQRDYGRDHAARYLQAGSSGPDPWLTGFAHFQLFMAAVQDGLLNEAERHVERFQEFEHHLGYPGWAWAEGMYRFALAAGNQAEADRYFDLAQAAYRRLGLHELEP